MWVFDFCDYFGTLHCMPLRLTICYFVWNLGLGFIERKIMEYKEELLFECPFNDCLLIGDCIDYFEQDNFGYCYGGKEQIKKCTEFLDEDKGQ
jgi:hypothetical protein